MRKDTIKVVYNDEFGGFALSKATVTWMKEHGYQGKFNSPAGASIPLPGDRHPRQDVYGLFRWTIKQSLDSPWTKDNVHSPGFRNQTSVRRNLQTNRRKR